MIHFDEGLLADLPDAVRRLVAAPPLTEKNLLELSVTWADLPSEQARMAEQLRLFVITWDPLDRLEDRPAGFATVNVDHLGLELVVYLPIWSVAELAAEQGSTVAGVLAGMAGAAVVTASGRERQEERERREGPLDLLSAFPAGVALGVPELRLVSPGWSEIGLGAITDVVQQAYGRVALDRSSVTLGAVARPGLGCPACAGRDFGFPGDLAQSRTMMCTAHEDEADRVSRVRLAQANASNPDGWAALTEAILRRERAHLPNGLATKLAGAEMAMYVIPEPEELADRARFVQEAASWFPDRREDFAVALGAEPDQAGFLPDWLMTLILDLGRAGLGAEAAMVGEALARVDPELRSVLDAEVAVALAEAGMAQEARERIASNLARWPDDLQVRLQAGDALAALGDRDGAGAHFEAAITLADDTDDFEARSEAFERLGQLGRFGRFGRLGDATAPRQQASNRPRRQPAHRSRSQRKGKGKGKR